MIGEVLVPRIAERDTIPLDRQRHVPAHEIGRVVDIGAPGQAATRFALVFCPSSVQRLTVAIGGAHATHGDDAQPVDMGRARVADESAFLIERRHLHRNRHAPAAFRTLHRPEILGPLGCQKACIVEISGRAEAAAAARGKESGRHDEKKKGFHVGLPARWPFWPWHHYTLKMPARKHLGLRKLCHHATVIAQWRKKWQTPATNRLSALF
jgi:hypothetical protein